MKKLLPLLVVGVLVLSGFGAIALPSGKIAGSNVECFKTYSRNTGPSLCILPGCIFGGINKVCAWIENDGDEDAINVNWSISVKGGILGRINIVSKGEIDKIEAQHKETVCTDKLIFGLGLVEINVTASAEGVEEVTQQRRGFVILFYVYLQSIT